MYLVKKKINYTIYTWINLTGIWRKILIDKHEKLVQNIIYFDQLNVVIEWNKWQSVKWKDVLIIFINMQYFANELLAWEKFCLKGLKLGHWSRSTTQDNNTLVTIQTTLINYCSLQNIFVIIHSIFNIPKNN